MSRTRAKPIANCFGGEQVKSMSKREKFLRRMRQNPKNIRFVDLCTFLESLGFRKRDCGGGGSHFTFTYPGSHPITIPRRIPFVLPTYIREVLNMVDELNLVASEVDEESDEIDEEVDEA